MAPLHLGKQHGSCAVVREGLCGAPDVEVRSLEVERIPLKIMAAQLDPGVRVVGGKLLHHLDGVAGLRLVNPADVVDPVADEVLVR